MRQPRLTSFFAKPAATSSSTSSSSAGAASSSISRSQTAMANRPLKATPAARNRLLAAPSTSGASTTINTNLAAADVITLSDEDDELLSSIVIDENVDVSPHQPDVSVKQRHGPIHVLADDAMCPGFDMSAGDVWIYPADMPLRSYQHNISHTCLFKNTFVSLPTGLGKTLIAAVVMYNFYRWYPSGKVLFVAPTRPLVEQQIAACYNIVGFPSDQMCVMTGKLKHEARDLLWADRRVFFLTAETLMHDLQRGVCPANAVRCLVIDEAHRATGQHAYCQCVNLLLAEHTSFRIVAMSATPGAPSTIQSIVHNLCISAVECRTEDAPDVRDYVHDRRCERILLKPTPLLAEFKTDFERVGLFGSAVQPILRRLFDARIIQEAEPDQFTAFKARLALQMFAKRPDWRKSHGWAAMQLAFLQSMYHHYDVLVRYGLRSLYHSFHELLATDGKKTASAKRRANLAARVHSNAGLQRIWEGLQDMFAAVPQANATMAPAQMERQLAAGGDGDESAAEDLTTMLSSHPKLEKLAELLQAHFTQTAASRAIVFSQYRTSVTEITELLKRFRPLIRPAEFKGQGGTSAATTSAFARGKTQKQQIEIVEKFKSGDYNVLCSTCVGEEGLDVGEVDLIVCYDATTSPGRLTQRMGRTGRQRAGRVVVLVTEGREENMYDRANYGTQHVQSVVLRTGGKGLQLRPSARLVPPGLHPRCVQLNIAAQQRSTPGASRSPVVFAGASSAANSRRRSNNKRMLNDAAFIDDQHNGAALHRWVATASEAVYLTASQQRRYDSHPQLAQAFDSLSTASWHTPLRLLYPPSAALTTSANEGAVSKRRRLLNDIACGHFELELQSPAAAATSVQPTQGGHVKVKPYIPFGSTSPCRPNRPDTAALGLDRLLDSVEQQLLTIRQDQQTLAELAAKLESLDLIHHGAESSEPPATMGRSPQKEVFPVLSEAPASSSSYVSPVKTAALATVTPSEASRQHACKLLGCDQPDPSWRWLSIQQAEQYLLGSASGIKKATADAADPFDSDSDEDFVPASPLALKKLKRPHSFAQKQVPKYAAPPSPVYDNTSSSQAKPNKL